MQGIEESREIAVMRRMAWERAKGELASMLQASFENNNYTSLDDSIRDFIEEVEDNGLHE